MPVVTAVITTAGRVPRKSTGPSLRSSDRCGDADGPDRTDAEHGESDQDRRDSREFEPHEGLEPAAGNASRIATATIARGRRRTNPARVRTPGDGPRMKDRKGFSRRGGGLTDSAAKSSEGA